MAPTLSALLATVSTSLPPLPPPPLDPAFGAAAAAGALPPPLAFFPALPPFPLPPLAPLPLRPQSSSLSSPPAAGCEDGATAADAAAAPFFPDPASSIRGKDLPVQTSYDKVQAFRLQKLTPVTPGLCNLLAVARHPPGGCDDAAAAADALRCRSCSSAAARASPLSCSASSATSGWKCGHELWHMRTLFFELPRCSMFRIGPATTFGTICA